MTRPKLPPDAIEFAKRMVDEGIRSGSVKYPDGMEVSWNMGDVSSRPAQSPYEAWKAKRDAT